MYYYSTIIPVANINALIEFIDLLESVKLLEVLDPLDVILFFNWPDSNFLFLKSFLFEDIWSRELLYQQGQPIYVLAPQDLVELKEWLKIQDILQLQQALPWLEPFPRRYHLVWRDFLPDSNDCWEFLKLFVSELLFRR